MEENQIEEEKKEYKIGDIVCLNEYTDAAIWCRENNATLTEINPEEETRRFEIISIPEPPTPTEEEQRENRKKAYTKEVDPITSHIERLKDEEQTEEIVIKINELKEERNLKIQEIKKRYPYA